MHKTLEVKTHLKFYLEITVKNGWFEARGRKDMSKMSPGFLIGTEKKEVIKNHGAESKKYTGINSSWKHWK